MTRIESAFVKVIFKVFEKGVNKLFLIDVDVAMQVASLPDNYKVRFSVFESTQVTVVENIRGVCYGFKGAKFPAVVDLDIMLKSWRWLPALMFGRKSLVDAYNKREIVVRGDIANAVLIIGIMEKIMGYTMSAKKYVRVYGHEPKLVVSRGVMLRYIVFGRRQQR